jgi:tetratricopeptide (TPR) repeat protein
MLRKATTLNSALPDPPFTLGVLLWQTGRSDEALKSFREALQRKSDYGDAYFMIGTVLKQQNATGEAIAQFKRAVEYRPLSAEAHRSLGQALLQQGDRAAGEASLAEAERLTRKAADAQASTFAVSVGERKIREGDYRGAIDRFREGVRLADDNPQAHFQLALALRKIGSTAEARRHLAAARRLAPYLRPPDDASW